MDKISIPHFGATSFIFAFLFMSGLKAQTHTATLPPAEPVSDDAETITLSEFSVNSTAPTEYAATESTTGTRVTSKIRDLPFAVNTVTAEFMNDFNALEFRDQLSYTSNVTGYETLSTGYSIRGFDADVQLRNGFRRIGLIDKVNIERVEIIKGPAASIYGEVFPGGTINFITRKPKAKPQQHVGFTIGDHDSLRAEASSTGPVGASKQFFYRVDAAADQRTYDQKFKERNQETVSLQMLWKPAAETSLLLEAEWLERRERGTSSATVPFLIQTGAVDPYRTSATRTYTRYVGIATGIIDFNSQGPHNYSNRFVKNLTATFEHRFNEILSLHSGLNWFDRGLTRQEVGGRDQFNPVTRTVQRGTDRFRPFPEGGQSWQNDLLAAFETGPVKHKLLVTFDYQRQTQAPRQYDAATNAAFPATVANGLSVDTPDYGFASYADNPSLFTTIQNEDDTIDIYGVFVSERATFFDGRLIALAGVRYDHTRSITRDYVLNQRSEFSDHAYTRQLGLNFRVLPAITLYANSSTSFVPQFGTGSDISGNTFNLPNQSGRGWEGGVKAGFLHDRLTFTAGYFDISLKNVASTTTDSATGRIITVIDGEQTSKGVELDFNWVATQNLQFFGGVGNTHAEIVNNAIAPQLIGTPTRRTPRNTVGVGAKYEFKNGRLKGVYLTAGFRYNSKSLANPSLGRSVTVASVTAANPFVNNPMPNGRLPLPQFSAGAVLTSIPYAIRVDDGRENIYNAPYGLLSLGGGYKWKTGRWAQKIQVNAGNVFDRRYTFGSTGQGDRLALSTTYDLTF